MPLFIWKPSYNLGIAEIDLDHRQLVGIINELYEAMKEGRGRDLINQTVDRLIDYVGEHFDREESIMRAAGFPDLSNHESAHQGFRAAVLEMDMRRRTGGGPSAIELLTYLSDWLRDHLTSTDKELGRYLKRTVD